MDDAWDWAMLYYAGTVILNMSPAIFWKSTPKKLDLLLRVHVELNSTEKSNSGPKKPKQGYIDQIF